MSRKNQSLLLTAVKNGDAIQLEKLIEEGVSIDKAGVLCVAVLTGNANIVKILLKNGVDIMQSDNNGYSALHCAISRNDFDMAKILLKSAFRCGKSRELLDMEITDTGNTALHLAAKLIDPNFRGLMDSNSYAMAILLLSYGAKFDSRNKRGIQPVDLSPGRHIAFTGILKMIELQFKLVKMGGKPVGFLDTAGTGEYVCATNCRDSRGYTLLQVVLRQGRKDVIKALLKLRSERSNCFMINEDQLEAINELSTHIQTRAHSLNERLKKLLEISSDDGVVKIVEEVLNDAREIVAAVRSYEQQTNLESIGNLDARSIEESVEYFANEYRKMLQDERKALTQLLMLAVYLPVRFVEQSIREAIAIDAVKRGDLERLERCFDENPKMTEKLIKATGNSNKQDPVPFHMLALMNLQQDISRPLINNFIEPIEKMYMSVHLAAKKNYLGIIKCLLKHGAVYCARDNNGKTPEELSSDENIAQFFKMTGKLFTLAKDGNIEFLTELKKLKNDTDVLAIAKARDEENHTLIEIAAKHQNIVEDLLQIVEEAEQNLKN